MLFRLISNGKSTQIELDGKTLGQNVDSVVFSHDKGEVKLTLVYNLSTAYNCEQRGHIPGVAEPDGSFDEYAARMERREKELQDEYRSLGE